MVLSDETGLLARSTTSSSRTSDRAEIAGAPPPKQKERGLRGIAFRCSGQQHYAHFTSAPRTARRGSGTAQPLTQYISHPDWTWSRLRRETPSRYESYVDLEADTWTKIRIEVRGTQARLYVHDQQQPALIVNDVKSGANAKGAVALWIEAGTVAHFRNLQ